MFKLHRNLSLFSCAAILSMGCASTPQQIPELESARAEVQKANSDPLAQEAAGIRLKKADEALRTAEDSFKQHKALVDIQHLSYVASRQAQIAEEQTKEVAARKDIEKGQAERSKVLLEARTTEAALAKTEADRAKADADRSKNLASAASDESSRLRSELENLQAKQTDRGMVLTLGSVLFASGKAILLPGAAETVDRLSEFLHKQPKLAVLVEGHTDNIGGADYNLDLSQRRADAVRESLLSRGVAGERIRSRGRGMDYPLASNSSPGSRQQNRRVEIIFSDENGGFSPAAERHAGQ